jgi:hypothetical protein
MATSPGSSLPFSPFANGFGLTESLDAAKQFWAGMPNLSGMPGMSQLSSSMTPTLDVDELDKRLQDLKTVQQWLELNLSMLRTTIQTMEVQRGTLVAIRSFSEAMQQPTAPSPASASGTAPNTSASNASWPHVAPTAAKPAASVAPEVADNAPDDALDESPALSPAAAPSEALDPAAWWKILQNQFAQAAGTSLAQQVAGLTPRANSTPGAKANTVDKRTSKKAAPTRPPVSKARRVSAKRNNPQAQPTSSRNTKKPTS